MVCGLPTEQEGIGCAGYRQHAPSPVSAAEAAAEAARRVKAEQQRAVARLPNIESHLHSVEKLVAQNAYQAEIAQCMHVKLCTGTTAEAAAGDSNSAGVNSHGQLDRLASIQQSISLVVEEESTQVTASASSSKAASSGSEPQAVWQWKSESSEELPVSCMSWNKVMAPILHSDVGLLGAVFVVVAGCEECEPELRLINCVDLS